MTPWVISQCYLQHWWGWIPWITHWGQVAHPPKGLPRPLVSRIKGLNPPRSKEPLIYSMECVVHSTYIDRWSTCWNSCMTSLLCMCCICINTCMSQCDMQMHAHRSDPHPRVWYCHDATHSFLLWRLVSHQHDWHTFHTQISLCYTMS